jgi:hypothetical protein
VITNVGMPEISGWARCRRLGISALLFEPVPPTELHRKVHVALAARAR